MRLLWMPRILKRMFRPVVEANGPAKLDLDGISPAVAILAIRSIARYDLIRALDDGSYVFTDGARERFLPLYKRAWHWLRMLIGV